MFTLVDTDGIPLDLVLDRLRAGGLMPDWLEFHDAAVAAGWHPSRLVSKLTEAVGDVYGPTFREEWERRFRAILDGREKK